ncbi:hypothetical protein J8I26_21230 [Herbaspirillum sp. LeCh32-8]|uniref:hypothetical protein n=1 Tax=Herbaspirillum sp. LeCh32-8 TaxID=2821356 RepID=UPI001AEAD388|nr:hypothetical protein [Herbaspirillum sp. LeCh32-8]MBP0600650.1 hypothetical protein [Herbaspirillum sp. LeCh32-8]
MEQYIRSEQYKEYELRITCLHDANGWIVDKLTVTRACATMFAHIATPYRFYKTAQDAGNAGLDDARHYVDGVWSGSAGNA